MATLTKPVLLVLLQLNYPLPRHPCLLALMAEMRSMRNEEWENHTENADDVFSLANLFCHCLVALLKSPFLWIDNLNGGVMHNIRNVPNLMEGLPGDDVDNETTKLRGSKLHEWRLHNDPSKKSQPHNKRPEYIDIICSTKNKKF